MYHDKQFQNDFYFPMVAFNESQIKRAKMGSHLLIEKRNITSVTSKLRALDGNVLANLARRLEAGEHMKDKSEAEQACFDILSELEHVGSHVQGSLASKKHQRNEVWSAVSFKGAPTWLITYAPADTLHPLSLYFADTKLEFSPSLRDSKERLDLIARNPVAAARFFNFVTEAFIKHILGVGSDHLGLYGQTDAYYGTVEQQEIRAHEQQCITGSHLFAAVQH
ncbi:hypothetical protein C8R45DRAFT_1057162 [Mycena sanguinolenta]|nr:hypothetical protein C8R45DRAFT_1057162 [Mycena sanguinolenta]